MLMAIIDCHNNNNKDILSIIQYEDNIERIVHKLCTFLDKTLQNNNSYCKTYKRYLKLWLQHDLYNFACYCCGAINNTIMVNRVMNYVTTLRNCRLCGITQPRLRNIGEKRTIYNSESCSDAINWFCSVIYTNRELRRNISIGALRNALLKCEYSAKSLRSSNPNYTKDTLLYDLRKVLQRPPYELFQDLVYYLRRFWDDVDDWMELRINICLNYYFYESKKGFVDTNTLMLEAGVSSYNDVIFKDSYLRAMFHTINQKDTAKLIEILFRAQLEQNRLCVDHRMLKVFRKLTPSINIFLTEILREFEHEIVGDERVNLLETFANYKIDRQVFSVLKKKEYVGAIHNFDEKEMERIGDDSELPLYHFGPFGEYWNKKHEHYVKPKYNHLADELMKNKIHKISKEEYKRYMEKVDVIYNNIFEYFEKEHGMHIEAQNRPRWCNRTGIKPGTKITRDHILCVLLHIDTNNFRSSVRHKLIKYDSTQKMIEKQSEVVHYLRLLKETVLLYGNLLGKNEVVYMGRRRKLLFNALQTRFHLPTSTTRNKRIAEGFAGDGGIVVFLSNIYNLAQPYFYVGKLSDHSEEDECIFFGAELTISDIQIVEDTVTDTVSAPIAQKSDYVRAIRLFQSVIDGRLIVDDEYLRDNKQLQQKIRQFIEVKIDKKSISILSMDRNHYYYYQLFSYLYDEIFRKRGDIWINMDEITNHINDMYLTRKFTEFGNQYQNIAKTFKWKVSAEELREFKHGMKSIQSSKNVIDQKGAFYLIMKGDYGDTHNTNEEDDAFDFVFCMDDKSWSASVNGVEISIDLYCEAINCRIVCDGITLTKNKPDYSLVSEFVNKYNGTLCTTKQLQKLPYDRGLTWEMSFKSRFIYRTIHKSKEDDEEKKDELNKTIDSCITNLHDPFLTQHKQIFIDHCNKKRHNVSSFMNFKHKLFAVFLKQLYDSDQIKPATCHKRSDARHKKFTRRRRSANKNIQDFTNDDLIAALENYILPTSAGDDANNQFILEYFKSNKMDGKSILQKSKKQFVNEIRKHGNDQKNIQRGKLRDLYTKIKTFDQFDGMQQAYCDHEKEIERWYKLYDEIKQRIKAMPDYDKSKRSTLLYSDPMNQEEWINKVWNKYHKRNERYHDTMTAVLLQDATIKSQLTQQQQLRIKTVLAYYELNKNEIPELAFILEESGLHIDDVDNLKQIYDTVRCEVMAAKEERAMAIQRIRADAHRKLTQRSLLMGIGTDLGTDFGTDQGTDFGTDTVTTDTQTRTSSVTGMSTNASNIEDREWHGHKEYDNGIFMRYTMLNPMYGSFAEECIMNTAYNITASAFNKILAKCKEMHNKITLISTTPSESYGIDMYEPIRVQHLMAILMYLDKYLYAKQLSKSYLMTLNEGMDKAMLRKFHCSNFYWFGRYLFEAVEFFGEQFDENSDYKLYQGYSTIFTFSRFGWNVNMARTTTPSMNVALHQGGNDGMIIELIPRYKGVLNATKFLNLSELSDGLYPFNVFFGRGCIVQISNIYMSRDQLTKHRLVAAITYFEKILKQTIFNSRFYNAKNLYSTPEITQKTLLNLIKVLMQLQDTNSSAPANKDETLDIVLKVWGAQNVHPAEHNKILYIVELLQHWCLKRRFVTFESFPFEIPYMNEELSSFFIQYAVNHKDYVINIDNICHLMPRLIFYRDCYQDVIYLDVDSLNVIDRMDCNLGKYYQEMNDKSYYCKSNELVGKFKRFCELEDLDAEAVKEELREEATDCILIEFDDDFPKKKEIVFNDSNQEMEFIYEILKESAKRNSNIAHVLSKYKEYSRYGRVMEPQSQMQLMLQDEDDDIMETLNTNLALYYQSVGDNTYYKDDYEDDFKGGVGIDDEEYFYAELDRKTEGKFKLWCMEKKYDEMKIIRELAKNDAEECGIVFFDDNFPLKMHIHSRKHRLTQTYNIIQKCRSRTEIIRYLNEYQAVFRVLPNLAPHEVADHIVDALEDIQFNFINHKYKEEMLQRLFEDKLKKITFQIEGYQSLPAFNKQLKDIGIAENIATDIFYELNIDNNEEKEAIAIEQKVTIDLTSAKKSKIDNNIIIEKVMNALKSEAFSYVALDVSEYKHIFATMFKTKLDQFYDPLSKLHGARKQDFIDVAQQMELFDNETVHKLSDFLFDKLFYDIEHIKPWECTVCKFLNRKMMVADLWRLYNQLNECGLCGVSRYNKSYIVASETQNRSNFSEEALHVNVPLRQDIERLKMEWSQVALQRCNFKHDDDEEAKHVYLDQYNVDETIAWIAKCMNNMDKLNGIRDGVMEWCSTQSINGEKLVNCGRKRFGKNVSSYVNDRKMRNALMTLYDATIEIDIGCGPLKRVCIILNHFDEMTLNLSTQKDMANARYPYELKEFLSSLAHYSPIQLLNDIDHILYTHPQTLVNQHYIVCKAEEANACPHILCAKREHDKSRTFQQKQQYFHCDNWKDYVYISTLAKIHAAILHKVKSDAINYKSDADTIKKYINFPVYSTGVFIQYHSEAPLHSNLRKELTTNVSCNISETDFEWALNQVHDLMQTEKWKSDQHNWTSNERNERYGVSIGDHLAVENVLVLYLYCNNSELCSKFRESYTRTIFEHNNNYYWFGRFIYCSIQFFGEKPQTQDIFYHGLSQKFLFDDFSAIYESPTSTTTDFSVAKRDFGDSGVVLTLAPKYNNELNMSKCLDIEHTGISSYDDEKERLFAGMTVLAIIDIGFAGSTRWHQLTRWIKVFLYFERIIEQSRHQCAFYNYGIIPTDDKQRNEFIKSQSKYLVPLIRHQMRRTQTSNNDAYDHEKENKKKEEEKDSEHAQQKDVKKQYLYVLFEHFCDQKRDYLNLRCIKDEKQYMHPSLQAILFDADEIHKENIKLIFPNLKQYKNDMGYWVTLSVNRYQTTNNENKKRFQRRMSDYS